jgi:hypothetical protein
MSKAAEKFVSPPFLYVISVTYIASDSTISLDINSSNQAFSRLAHDLICFGGTPPQ